MALDKLISLVLNQIRQHFKAAIRDLKIAKQSDMAEVVFKFSYDALIKLGIALITRQGYKVRSVVGHHVKILEKMSQILKNSTINHITEIDF